MSVERPITFRVLGTGLWVFGTNRVDALTSPISESEIREAVPVGESIEKRTRRRATLLSRASADAFFQATEAAGVDRAQVPTVFCSALGETPAMIEQVDHVCRGVELSPMRFAVSVHSSSSTVVTISEKNRRLTSSISANFDTVAAGLFEMAAILSTQGGPGVVVFGDDHSPDQFLAQDERYARLAVALVLSIAEESSLPAGSRVVSLPRLASPPETASTPGTALLRPPPMPGLVARNPVVGALDLVVALAQGRAGSLRLDRGQGSGYQVSLGCPSLSPRGTSP